MNRLWIVLFVLVIAGCASSSAGDGSIASLQPHNTAREWMLASSDARQNYIERWLAVRTGGTAPDERQVMQIEAHTVNRLANRYREWARKGKFRGEPDPMRASIDSFFGPMLGVE